jgi:hypothetical protein
MLANVHIVLGDMSDRLDKVEKYKDDSNSNNHDIHGIGAKRRVNHDNSIERHVEANFGDFGEDDDDFGDKGFEAETLGLRGGF